MPQMCRNILFGVCHRNIIWVKSIAFCADSKHVHIVVCVERYLWNKSALQCVIIVVGNTFRLFKIQKYINMPSKSVLTLENKNKTYVEKNTETERRVIAYIDEYICK